MVRLIALSLILVGASAVLGAGCEPNGNYARLAQSADDGGGKGGAPGPASGTGGLAQGDSGGSGVVVSSGGVAAVGSGGHVSATGGVTSQVGGAGGHASGAAGTSGGTGGTGSGSGGTTGVGGGRATGGSSASSGGVPGTGGVVATGGVTSSGGSGGITATGGATGAGGKGGSVATPRMLSVDFVGGVVAAGGAGGASVSGTVMMAATESAGVKPAKNWNSAAGPTGALSTLTLSDGGAATGAGVSWNAPIYTGSVGTYAIGYPDAPGDVRMMNGCLNPGWTGTAPTTPVTVVSFTGLPASITTGGYDVYVYVLGGIPNAETRLYTYTIGTVTFNVSQPGPTPTTPASPYAYTLAPDASAGNYIVFRNVTGAAFDLKVKPGSSSGTMRSPINGIQIVWPAGS